MGRWKGIAVSGALLSLLASGAAAAGVAGGGSGADPLAQWAKYQAAIIAQNGLKNPDLSRFGLRRSEAGVYEIQIPIEYAVPRAETEQDKAERAKNLEELKKLHPDGKVWFPANRREIDQAIWRMRRAERIKGDGTREKTEAWMRGRIKSLLPASMHASVDALAVESLPALYDSLDSGKAPKFENPKTLEAFAARKAGDFRAAAPNGDWLDAAFDGLEKRVLPVKKNGMDSPMMLVIDEPNRPPQAAPEYFGMDRRFDKKLFASLPVETQKRLLNHHLRSEGFALGAAEMFEHLKEKNDGALVHYRAEVLSFLKSSNDTLRSKAVYLLGRMARHELAARMSKGLPAGDLSLVPVLKESLKDPDGRVRENAAMALAAVIGGYHAYGWRVQRDRDGGLAIEDVIGRLFPGKKEAKGWDAFTEHAPALIEALALARAQHGAWEAGRGVENYLSYLHLMPESSRRKFVDGFKDPAALIAMIGASSDRDVREFRGIHTVEGNLLQDRITKLLDGKPISEFLDKGGVPDDTATAYLARLKRFGVLDKALEKDPKLFDAYAGLIFRRPLDLGTDGNQAFEENPKVKMKVSEFNLAAEELWRADPVKMKRTILAMLDSAEGDRKKALAAYVQFHSDRFGPGGARRAAAALPPEVAERVAKLSRNDEPPSYYGAWPKNRTSVGLVFSQAGWAESFMKHLAQNGYRRGKSRAVGEAREFSLTGKVDGKEVTIKLRVLPSNDHGWAKDRSAVTRSVAEFFNDPSLQAVMYRGHIGDYDSSAVAAVKTRKKVFVDLGCGSESNSGVIAGCEDCDYFGTTTVAKGAVNNTFTRSLIGMLAKRSSYGTMRKMIQGAMPQTYRNYTGPYAMDQAYVRAQRLAAGKSEYRPVGEGGLMVDAIAAE